MHSQIKLNVTYLFYGLETNLNLVDLFFPKEIDLNVSISGCVSDLLTFFTIMIFT